MQVSITWPLDPYKITGRVCPKLPQKQTTLLPKNISLLPYISCRLRLTAFISNRFYVGDLSQKITSARLMSSARFVLLVILHDDVASTSNRILNREWAVRPSCNNVAAILDDATTRATRCSDRSFYITVFWTIVLPVPSGPLRKKMAPWLPNLLSVLFSLIASRIVSALYIDLDLANW